jgi:hypothetical protein
VDGRTATIWFDDVGDEKAHAACLVKAGGEGAGAGEVEEVILFLKVLSLYPLSFLPR